MGAADIDAIVAWLRIGGLKVSIQGFQIGALCSSFARTVYLRSLTSGAKAEGRFGKRDFVYVAEDNVYLCPATMCRPHGSRCTDRGAESTD
jgi:hypothetical protein